MKLKIFSAILLALSATFGAIAQDMAAPVSKVEKDEIISSIINGYSNWGRVSLTGKLTSSMLPATATVKVYMEKDKLTLISVAAPLLGEVARIELDKDYLLVVNKWSKKYVTVATSDIERIYPGVQADLQNLLLGRITIMGKGSLTKRTGEDVDVYDIGQGDMMIVPSVKYQPEGASYAYVVSGPETLLSQFLMLTEDGENEMTCYFDWKGNAMTMEFMGYTSSFGFEGKIAFGDPSWGAKPMDRFELTSKYSLSTLRGILQM